MRYFVISIHGPAIFFFISQLKLFLTYDRPRRFSMYRFISSLRQDREGHAGQVLTTNCTEQNPSEAFAR
jgi:hypothetical protein